MKSLIKRVATGMLLLAFGGLIGLLALELVLRLVGYSYPSWGRTDEHVGFALRPGAKGWYRQEGKS